MCGEIKAKGVSWKSFSSLKWRRQRQIVRDAQQKAERKRVDIKTRKVPNEHVEKICLNVAA